MLRLVGTLAYYALKPFIIEIKGVENIPGKACIFVSNHASYVDGPLVGSVIAAKSGRIVHFVIWKTLFEKLWQRFLLKTVLKQISVGGAVQKSVECLKDGESIGLFPEGRRTKNGLLCPTTHTGLGVMHLLSRAHIVPVAIKGSFEWWPCNRLLPEFTRKIKIIIGKPRSFNKKLSRRNALQMQKEVMQEIQDMLQNN